MDSANGTKPPREGTRVFKKSSPNGKITAYLGKRDFVDHISYVDPIDGVVLVDPEYLKDRKVYGQVLAAFRYGREDLDVLGLTFRKELFCTSAQIYPPPQAETQKPLTRLQERLMKKLGKNACPFFFELPPNCPASVTLQPAQGDTGKPCGIDYELKCYVSETPEEKPHKRNSVRLVIRKVMYAPQKQGEQPSTEVVKNRLHLEVSLDKALYYHGETIDVNVHVQNNSTKSVKKVRVSVRQFADICLYASTKYKCTVAEVESEESCPIGPGFNMSKIYSLTPLLANNKDKFGLALDGQLKHEDTNLASSTLQTDHLNKDFQAIVVRYNVKVKLDLGKIPFGGELCAELPFMLMHPKPPEEAPLPPLSRGPSVKVHKKTADDGSTQDNVADEDLIHLDEEIPSGGGGSGGAAGVEDEDDFIFEDFARLRLKGETDA